MTLEELTELIKAPENEHCEFKAAENQFAYEELCEYCVALANEKGGKLILGVSDKIPRQIVGTSAFPDQDKTKNRLLETLHFRVDVYQIESPSGRVLVFNVPARPIGTPRD